MIEGRKCKWEFYKDLWHTECNCFLTSTVYGELSYVHNDIPFDRICPDCGKSIEIVERRFGRRMNKKGT